LWRIESSEGTLVFPSKRQKNGIPRNAKRLRRPVTFLKRRR
jgi:hypothetical protein